MSRIDAIRFGCVQYDKGRPDLVWGRHRIRHAAIVAMVRSSDGAVGLGTAWAQPGDETCFAPAARAALADLVLGADTDLPFRSARAVTDHAHASGTGRAAAIVEMALFDLAGRTLEVPTYQLLGLKRREIPSYVISAEEFCFVDQTQFTELAQRYVEAGFRACKFHLWGDRKRDIAACRAIRSTVGPDIVLMLDAVSRYGREDALAVGRAIAELGFQRFEDPISPDDRAGYRWLAPRLDVPVVVNDALRWSVHDCAEAARESTVQGFRFDVGRAGLTQGLAFAAVAEAHGAELDMTGFSPRPGLEACFALSLSATTSRWFEHHEALGLDDVPGLAAGFSVTDGVARPSGRPGLGYEVDHAELDRYCTWLD